MVPHFQIFLYVFTFVAAVGLGLLLVKQQGVHLVWVSELAVNVRFAFFMLQGALLAAMGARAYSAVA